MAFRQLNDANQHTDLWKDFCWEDVFKSALNVLHFYSLEAAWLARRAPPEGSWGPSRLATDGTLAVEA